MHVLNTSIQEITLIFQNKGKEKFHTISKLKKSTFFEKCCDFTKNAQIPYSKDIFRQSP